MMLFQKFQFAIFAHAKQCPDFRFRFPVHPTYRETRSGTKYFL